MKLSDLKQLWEVAPNATMQLTGSVISVFDTNGHRIGHIDFYENAVTIYKDYQFSDEIVKRLEEKNGALFDRDLQRQLLYELDEE